MPAAASVLVTYTLFPDVFPRTKTERADVPWLELVERVSNAATYLDKAHCPLISMAEYGDARTEKDCLRHAGNVRRIYGVELDYDGERITVAEAAAMLSASRIETCLYTSASHQAGKPRWRVLAPLADPATPDQRAALVGRLNRILGGVASRESFTLSQSYYIGRVRGAAYETAVTHGRCIDEAFDIEPLYFTGQGGGGETKRDLTTDAQLREAFTRGEDRYQAMLKLSARWAARGMDESDIATSLGALFGDGDSKNGDGIDLRKRIPGIAASAVSKFGESRRPALDRPPPGEPPPWLDAEHGAEAPEEAQEASAPEPALEAGRPERRPLDWLTLAQAQAPQREWAIPHWLGFGYVTLLAGPGGVGKSLLAQQMASSIAVADEFLETLSIPRRVLMWAGEDDTEELWRRQLAIASAQHRELGEYRDLIVESYAGRDCTLATTVFGKLEPTAMLKELAEQVEDYDADVVFLDNVARLFGGSENDRHQVTLFINLVAGACNGRRQRAVVLLGHPAKAEGSEWAGSTAWEAAVRSRWYFGRTLPDAKDDEEAAADPNQRFLARRKSNYSGLEARQMRYDASRHVLVMEQAAAPIERGLHPTRAENVVLEALEQLVKQGVSTSDEKRSSAFLPRVMVDRKLATKGQVGALTDALYRLQKAGRVVRMQVGQYPNRTAKMGLGVAQ